MVLVVPAASRYRTLQDYVAAAKQPGAVSYASVGAGSSNHLAAELFHETAGSHGLHVPFKGGGPAITDLIGGHVDSMIASLPLVLQQVQSGKLRALAVTSPRRSAALPDVPAVAETYKGFEVYSWVGMVAPAKTPALVLDKLSTDMTATLRDPEVAKRLSRRRLRGGRRRPRSDGPLVKARERALGPPDPQPPDRRGMNARTDQGGTRRPFVFQSRAQRVLFGAGTLARVAAELDAMGARKALVLCTPQQRAQAEQVAGLLGSRAAGIFDGAVMHVPMASARAARAAAERAGADAAVAVGGGSTIGLGKAIALDSGLPILAVPTTYAGSEMTPIYGLTEDGLKRTGRDPRVLPRTRHLRPGADARRCRSACRW